MMVDWFTVRINARLFWLRFVLPKLKFRNSELLSGTRNVYRKNVCRAFSLFCVGWYTDILSYRVGSYPGFVLVYDKPLTGTICNHLISECVLFFYRSCTCPSATVLRWKKAVLTFVSAGIPVNSSEAFTLCVDMTSRVWPCNAIFSIDSWLAISRSLSFPFFMFMCTLAML